MSVSSRYADIQAKGMQATLARRVAMIAGEEDFTSLLAETNPSDGASENYGFVGDVPQMQDVTDEPLVLQDLTEASYTITSKTWKAGIAVKEEDFEDDRNGVLAMRLNQLAPVASRHRNKLMIDALINGTTDTGYDGSAFYADAHATRGAIAGGPASGAQDNLLAGTGSSTAQVSTDFGSGVTALASFKAENGEPINEMARSYVIVAHPTMRKPMLESLTGQFTPSTSTLENKQIDGMTIKFIFTARLTDTNDWYLCVGDAGFRPLIFQPRVELSYRELTAQSESAIKDGRYYFTVRARYNAGYSLWQSSVKIVNS